MTSAEIRVHGMIIATPGKICIDCATSHFERRKYDHADFEGIIQFYNSKLLKLNLNIHTRTINNMDYSSKTKAEIIVLCKEKHIKGYSGKKREDLLKLIQQSTVPQKQDTGKFRTNNKDQFYTKETVAKSCIDIMLKEIPNTQQYLWVEPSAGNGSFLHQIPSSYDRLGLDLDPKAEDILQQDFLQWNPPENKDIIIFGNPPFGRQSSLAKSFIAKSCTFAKVIAFILPKSFTKPSMYRAFDLKFHLLQSINLEKNSFVINGSPYDVPCVFQIWVKKDIDRSKEEKINPIGFQYVKHDQDYDIAFRRVGGLAGKCFPKDTTEYCKQSHYFIRLDDSITPHKKKLIKKINQHTFPSNTVGPRSLSKSEVNLVINRFIQSISS